MAKSNNATTPPGNEIYFKTKTLENKSSKPSKRLFKVNRSIIKKQSTKNKRRQRANQMIERAIYEASKLYNLRMIERAIQKASKLHNLPPALINALIQVESNGNRYAISKANAKGLTQLLPATAKEMGVHDPFDIEQNIIGGSGYLKKQLQKFENLFLGLVAYNWGPRNALHALQGKKKIPRSVRRYANRIIQFYRKT